MVSFLDACEMSASIWRVSWIPYTRLYQGSTRRIGKLARERWFYHLSAAALVHPYAASTCMDHPMP